MTYAEFGKDESAYEERILRLERNAWTDDPGETAPALEPPAEHVLKTLPERSVSVYPAELPPLPNEITRTTTEFLQVSSGEAANRWMVVLIFPMLLVMLVGFPLTAVLSLISSDVPWMAMVFFPIAAIVAGRFAWGMLHVIFYMYEDEPLRFHRTSGKVYRFRVSRTRIMGMDVPAKERASVVVYDWSNLRAEITRQFLLFGPTGRRDSFLQLAVVDPATGKVTERFRIGDRDTHGGFTDRVLLWESIRRYMEEGPERVPPASLKLHRNNLPDSFEEFNPFSHPGKFPTGGQRFFGYLVAVAVWATSPLLMYAALCRWIAGKTGRKVDWGELEQTVFQGRTDDPAAKDTLDPSIEAPKMWAKETRRRKRALWVWMASMGVYWLFPAYLIHAWPYCDCSPEARFCIELESLCPRWNYGDPMPPAAPAPPAPMESTESPSVLREDEPAARDPAIEAYERLMRNRDERLRPAQE